MSVVKSSFKNGKLLNRKIVAEFSTIKEAESFCNDFVDTNMKQGCICITKNNGWTVNEPICIPGWIINGVEYSKIFSLKIIDSNPVSEVLSELQEALAGRVGRSEPIDIIH